MQYDPTEINVLFEKFVATRANADFDALLEKCKPMLYSILQRYELDKSTFEDVAQTVMLKVWKNLKQNKKLEQQKINAVVYLFSTFMGYCLYELRVINRDATCFREFADELIRGSRLDTIDPERRYLVKERILKLIETCRKQARSRLSITGHEERIEELMAEIQKIVSEDFGGLL